MTYPDTLAMTLAGESLGFESSLLAEHYYPSGTAAEYEGGLGNRMAGDAWMFLAGLSRETKRIRLGTLVSPVTFRHPSVLAKMAATLDHMSGGRAELGIGAGWLEQEHSAYGFPFAEPGRRVDLVEEQLEVINGLFSQSPFSHSGAAYTLKDAYFTPKPVQQPRPWIIIGGRTTSQRLTRLAGKYADEFVIGQPTPDDARAMRARLDRACQSAGRDPSSVKLSAFVPFAIADSSSAVDSLMRTYRETNPQDARMMSDTSTWLKGTPAEVQSQIQNLTAAGIDRIMISVNCDQHREMLPLLIP